MHFFGPIGLSFTLFIFTSSLIACPFAQYKKDRFVCKEIVVDTPQISSKEILNHMHQRYGVVLDELQYQLQYDYLECQQKIKVLENFLVEAETFTEKRAIKKTARALKLILDENFKIHLVGRERYRDFIEAMRLAIETKNSAQWANPKMFEYVSDILQHLSYSLFTVCLNQTAVGYEYFWKVVPKHLTELESNMLNVKLLNKTINKIFPKSAPHVLMSSLNRKFHNAIFANWDGALSTLRSKLATYQYQGRSVSLLRMSCPIYGKNYRAVVDPIFLEYLTTLKKQNKKHLYISNLDTTVSTYSSAFKNSALLQKLSKQSPYDESFLFVVLPVDSAFYKQGNLGLLRASYFKETFLNSMLLKQEGFYFPSTLLKNSQFISYLSQMLDDIHQLYYENHEFLEREDRCQFIDIAYAYITKYLIEDYKADFVNWTGRNGVDESMGAMAILDVLLQSVKPHPVHLESTLYITLWPALLHYHRHPSTVTTIRSYSAIRKLLDQKPVLEAIQANLDLNSEMKL